MIKEEAQNMKEKNFKTSTKPVLERFIVFHEQIEQNKIPNLC